MYSALKQLDTNTVAGTPALAAGAGDAGFSRFGYFTHGEARRLFGRGARATMSFTRWASKAVVAGLVVGLGGEKVVLGDDGKPEIVGADGAVSATRWTACRFRGDVSIDGTGDVSIDGKPLYLSIQIKYGIIIPDAILRSDDKQRNKFIALQELIVIQNRFFAEHTSLKPGAPASWREFVRVHGADLDRLGLPRSRSAMFALRKRVEAGELPDGRGRRKTQNGGERNSATPDAWAYFKKLYLAPQKRTTALCYDIVAARAGAQGWRWPSLRTIQLRAKRELDGVVGDLQRLGQQRWKRKYGPCIRRDLSGVRPNQVWIGDHSKLDFLARGDDGKPVRPWVTAWEDQRSRVIVGYVITTDPDSDAILAAFREGVLEYGAPASVLIDNGKDYRAAGVSGGKKRNARFIDETRARSVFGRLDVSVSFCEPFNPGSKAIERFFGTMHERYCKLHDSYIGDKPDDRPEDLYERLKAGNVELPTLDEVARTFSDFLHAYHRTPHRGDSMDGLCPFDAFRQFDPLPRRTAPREWLDLLLRRTYTVKVTRHGVRHNDVYYGQGNIDLLMRQGQSVQIRIDPDHADRVEVCDLAGVHITWAVEQRLTGQTQDDVKELRRRRKRLKRLAKEALPAVAESRKSIVQMSLEAQAERAEQLRAAAGGEDIDATSIPRALSIIRGGAGVSPADVGSGFRVRSLCHSERREESGLLFDPPNIELDDAPAVISPLDSAPMPSWECDGITDDQEAGQYFDPLDALPAVDWDDPVARQRFLDDGASTEPVDQLGGFSDAG